MVYVVGRPKGRFELRETRRTEAGPRSRTLATFTVLDDDVLDHARDRAGHPIPRDQAVAAARRAGAPVAPPKADLLVGDLLVELDAGRPMRPALRKLLAARLAGEPTDHHLEAMVEYLDWTPEQRGRVVRELLDLADAYPDRRLPKPSFPRIVPRG